MWKHRPWKPIYFIYPQFNLLRSSKASFIDCYEYWARPACRLEPLVYSADWRSKDRLKTWIFDGIKWAHLLLTDIFFFFLLLFEELISAFKLDQIWRLLFLQDIPIVRSLKALFLFLHILSHKNLKVHIFPISVCLSQFGVLFVDKKKPI